MANTRKVLQRIRDPLHDLIEFEDDEFERALWDVIQTQPFQRLRRIKQLGFTDLVYPGASHSRFAHSIGVYHTARALMEIIRDQSTQKDSANEKTALAAALVHDLATVLLAMHLKWSEKNLALNWQIMKRLVTFSSLTAK